MNREQVNISRLQIATKYVQHSIITMRDGNTLHEETVHADGALLVQYSYCFTRFCDCLMPVSGRVFVYIFSGCIAYLYCYREKDEYLDMQIFSCVIFFDSYRSINMEDL